MSVIAPEDAVPAALAISAARAAARARMKPIRRAIKAFLAGAFDLATTVAHLARHLLWARWTSTLAGAKQARQEWNVDLAPTPQPPEVHERLTEAVQTVMAEPISEEFEVLAIFRFERLVTAECLTAAREGYAEVTESALGEDLDDYEWHFITDADPCAKCVELATKTFATFEEAPEHGGHIGCACYLSCEMRENQDHAEAD